MAPAAGRSANVGRPRAPQPRKGVQRHKDNNTNARAATPVFTDRTSIADPNKPRPRRTATCANPLCVKPEIVDDDGTKVCVTCGTVAQDTNIVAEITFGESSTGAAIVQGTYVGADQRHGRGGPGPRGFGSGDDSPNRAQTLNLARVIVSGLISRLGLPSNMTEVAMHTFQAVHHNMVQGRSIRAVAAVGLYVACRRRNSVGGQHIMLIDIAENMNFNVFMLGSIYTKMVRFLYKVQGWEMDIVNPENLILRFARSMEFGRETNRIVNEATRLVQRMSRDWMVTGRRPAGICGAALIIAARMNNYRRTVREMVYIVKVTEVTINKRLEEFKETDASKFTIDEFRNTDLLSLREHDPPAFTRAQQGPKDKRKRRRQGEEPETAAEIEDDGSQDEETQEPSTQRRRIDKDGFAIPDIPIDPALRDPVNTQGGPIDEALTSAVNHAISEMERDQSQQPEPDPKSARPEDQWDTASVTSTDTSATGSTTISETTGLPRKRGRGRPKGAKNKGPLPLSEAELALEAAIENEVRSGLEEIAHESEKIQHDPSRTAQSPSIGQQSTPPTTQPEHDQTASHPIPTSTPSQPDPASETTREIPMTQEIGEHEFDSDPEVANCLLSPEEIAIREQIWVHENNSWLREQHRKMIREQLKQADPNYQPPPDSRNKKRKKKPRLGDPSYLKENREKRGEEAGEQATKDVETEGTAGTANEGNNVAGDGAANGEEQDPVQGADSAAMGAARSIKMMLDYRGFSSRFNYQNFSALFPGIDPNTATPPTPADQSTAPNKKTSTSQRETRKQTRQSHKQEQAASPSSTVNSAFTRPQTPLSSSSAPLSPSPSAQLLDPTTSRTPAAAAVVSTPTSTSQPDNLKVLGPVSTSNSDVDVDDDDDAELSETIMGNIDDEDDEEEDDDEDVVEEALQGRWLRSNRRRDDSDDED